jgi:hypothetical protein
MRSFLKECFVMNAVSRSNIVKRQKFVNKGTGFPHSRNSRTPPNKFLGSSLYLLYWAFETRTKWIG